MHRLTCLVAASLFALSACSQSDKPVAAAASAAAPAAPVAAMAAAPATAPAPNRGKVLQVLEGGGYTYAEVEVGPGRGGWMAGSHIAIKAGDTIEWGSASLMRNFTSKTIGRTFSEILFVDQWGPAGAMGATAAMASPHGGMTAAAPTASPHGGMPAAAPMAAGGGERGVVKSVSNAGGYSYIEVDRGGAVVWVAAMETPMKAGDRIEWQGGSSMQNFTAKSIGRTFDRIIFASSVAVVN